MTSLLLTAALALAAPACVAEREIVQLEGMRVVTRDSAGRPVPLDFWAYGTPGSVLVAVVPTTEGWRYRDCHFIRWVVDGVPMSWETRHEGRVSALGNEVITLRLQGEEFQRFAAARSVEGRLCGDEFTFDADQLATWRRMAGRVDLAGR